MTGQGNSAFNVLLRHPIFNLVGVFTRKKFDAPYPYYLRKQLNQIVEENRIPIFENFVLREENTIKIPILLSLAASIKLFLVKYLLYPV